MVIAVLEDFVVRFPLVSIIFISFIMSLVSTLLMRHFTDQEHLRGLKKRQKELQKEIRESQKKKEFTKLEELNKEMVDISISMIKSSFNIKMMLITIIPFLLLFSWLKGLYNPLTPEAEPLLKYWFFWYLGGAILSSTIYRKLFKMA
jgi:uncharacterized membrane protein (DUF106 family)